MKFSKVANVVLQYYGFPSSAALNPTLTYAYVKNGSVTTTTLSYGSSVTLNKITQLNVGEVSWAGSGSGQAAVMVTATQTV